ncbi:MAG: hypothetical protein L3K19_02350 [Thermoplasmata archaeon]|nr:hypothetical protein [Thermoplasmata archaeon]
MSDEPAIAVQAVGEGSITPTDLDGLALEVRAEVARRIAAVGWELRTEIRREGDTFHLVLDGPDLREAVAAGASAAVSVEIDGRSAPRQAARVLGLLYRAGVRPTPNHPEVFDRVQSIWCAPG